MNRRDGEGEGEPPPVDIEIGAAASAKRVRFNRKPEVEVRFRGGESASVSQRENLPDEVEPGVTYRDVRVGWVGAARIAEVDERVEEIERREGGE